MYQYGVSKILSVNLLLTKVEKYSKNCNIVKYSCDAQLYFQHHYSSLWYHTIFQKSC